MKIVIMFMIVTLSCGQLVEVGAPRDVRKIPETKTEEEQEQEQSTIDEEATTEEAVEESCEADLEKEYSFKWNYTTFSGLVGFKLYYSVDGGQTELIQTLTDPDARTIKATGISLDTCNYTYKFYLTSYTSSQESDPSDIACIGIECPESS